MNSPSSVPTTAPASRIAAGRRRPGSRRAAVSSAGVTFVSTDAAQLRERLGDGRHRRGSLHRGSNRERAGAPAHVESGADAVCVALLLAQVHLEPRVKRPPRIAAMTCTAWKSGTRRLRPTWPDPELGLDRAGAVIEANDRPIHGRLARGVATASVGSGSPLRPRPERAEDGFDDGRASRPVRFAADHHGRLRCVEYRSVGCPGSRPESVETTVASSRPQAENTASRACRRSRQRPVRPAAEGPPRPAAVVEPFVPAGARPPAPGTWVALRPPRALERGAEAGGRDVDRDP